MAAGIRLQMEKPISTVAEFLNLCQDETNAQICCGIKLKNNYTSVK
jgi:hypothetical protein